MERVADRVAILRRGRLVVIDSLDNMRRVAVQHLEIEFEGPAPPTTELLAIPGVRDATADGARLAVSFEGAADQLITAVARYEVRSIRSRDADLEEIFLRFYRDEDPT